MTISATIIGRLGKDPETRQAGSHSVTELRVATRHGFGDREVTTWLSVSLWGRRGETAAKHLRRGDSVILTGCSIYNEEWEGKHYLKAEASGFEFAPKAREGGSQGPREGEPTPRTQRRAEANSYGGGGYGGELDVPF